MAGCDVGKSCSLAHIGGHRGAPRAGPQAVAEDAPAVRVTLVAKGAGLGSARGCDRQALGVLSSEAVKQRNCGRRVARGRKRRRDGRCQNLLPAPPGWFVPKFEDCPLLAGNQDVIDVLRLRASEPNRALPALLLGDDFIASPFAHLASFFVATAHAAATLNAISGTPIGQVSRRG